MNHAIIGNCPNQLYKFPFKYSFLWLDGRFTAIITDVKVNVPVDAAGRSSALILEPGAAELFRFGQGYESAWE
jgi:hypothetical protein